MPLMLKVNGSNELFSSHRDCSRFITLFFFFDHEISIKINFGTSAYLIIDSFRLKGLYSEQKTKPKPIYSISHALKTE